MSACAPAGTLLGQTTEYVDTYRPDLLTPIPRSLGRDAIGVHDFRGTDVWRLYEITWINERGLPVAAAGEIPRARDEPLHCRIQVPEALHRLAHPDEDRLRRRGRPPHRPRRLRVRGRTRRGPH